MSYGGFPYGGVAYAASEAGGNPETDTDPILSIEIAFTTGALETPVWETVTSDVRSWDVSRGRNRELERFQPGRATIVLGNRERQYDSVYDAGPHFGDIKPMRRIRIRQTFNGVTYPVFDGFIDRWRLDYPGVGKDATATVTATDAFKVFARTELPRSVYTDEVETDAPTIWWRLDENLARLQDGSALNSGTAGHALDGVFVADPRVGSQGLIVNDPGTSMTTASALTKDGTPRQGVTLANASFSLLSKTIFSVEAWVRPDAASATGVVWSVSNTADISGHAFCATETDGGSGLDNAYTFLVFNSAFTLVYGVRAPNNSMVPPAVNHVVCTVESGGQMAITVDGTRYTTTHPLATASTLSGVTRPTNGDFKVAHVARVDAAADANINWLGEIGEVAVYETVLSSTRITAHNAAGRTPWQGDLPGERLDRVLDIAQWSSTAREIDDGATTLQSAEIGSQSVLEHSQKIGETEFGLLFIDRTGNVRLVSRANVWSRAPGPEIYGDEAGQVGYTDFTPDDGDEVVRNVAVISRLNGAAQTIEDATSIDEFGRFEYRLEGLLHDSDSYSRDYAQTIVGEHANPRRRITSLSLGPAAAGEEGTVYPAMLGRELGDYITVTNTPLGGGDPFEQICAVEGIRISGTPKILTATFALSPMLGGELPMDWVDWTPTLANLTLGNGTVVARYARAGNTVLFHFQFTLGSTSAVGTAPTFSLPFTAAWSVGDPIGVARLRDVGGSSYGGTIFLVTTSTALIRAIQADATYAFEASISSTVPITWNATDVITVSGMYEAA